MTHPTSSGPDRSTHNGLIIAGIGAAATIVAAIIAAVIGLAAHNSESPSSFASSPMSTPSPAPSSASAAAQRVSQPSIAPTISAAPAASPLPSSIPILRPVDDPGFAPVWNGTFTINAAGVRISSSGVTPGNPQDWDLAYQSGGGASGWQMNINNGDNGAIYPYEGSGTPDPAWCQRDYFSANDAVRAEVGDRDCYADANGMVGYLQVTSITPNGPTIAAWFWKGQPLS